MMKPISNINKFLLGTLMIATFSCTDDDEYSVPEFETCTETVTTTADFSDIKALATSESADELTADNGGIFEAYVVSSDVAGEFYTSIYIVSKDGKEGMFFSVDRRDNYIAFEPGRQIFIDTEGLYIAQDNDGVALGGLYNGGVGRLELSKFNTAVTRGCSTISEEDLVQKISTLGDALSDDYLNELIEIDSVQFQDIETIPTYYDATNQIGGATNHVLEDVEGNSYSDFVVRFSSYADHAKEKVATGSGSIRGVLTKYGGTYQLIVRTVDEDIKFTNDRFDIVTPNDCERTLPEGTLPFTDDFEAYTAGDSSTDNWTVIIEEGTRSFEIQEYNDAKYMQMSAYNSGESNTTWMISPVFDIDSATDKVLSFEVADAFQNGNPLKLVYSTDYDGSDCPANFTWTEIASDEIAALINNSGSYDNSFESTGNIDISAISGSAVFAIVYEGSASGITTTVQIDNFVVGQNVDDSNTGGDIVDGTPENVFFSEYAEGSSNNKYFEIYNGTGAALDLSAYKVLIAVNGGGWGDTPLDLSGTLAAGDVYVVGTDALDASIAANADLTLAYPSPAHFNGDDAIALVKDNAGTLEIIDIIGDPLNRPTDGWDVAGTTAATKDHTLIRKTTVTTGNIDWSASAGTSTSNSEWEVQAQNYWDNMGLYGESQSSNTAPVAAVTITGTTTVGELLTADTSTSSDADGDTLTFTYQWYRADDSSGTNEIMISGATASTYTLTTNDQDKYITVKVIANDGTEDSTEATASYTTQVAANTGGGSTLSDLIISEYVEPNGGNHKYLEIYNGTGADIDLSSYTLAKDSNGDDDFVSTTATLSGTIANGEVIVYANSAATAYTGTTQTLSTESVMYFNGNDQIALLKNGTIIDKIGNSGGANFAKDQTLRRKNTVTGPNSTYTEAEWDFITNPSNDVQVDGLGSF